MARDVEYSWKKPEAPRRAGIIEWLTTCNWNGKRKYVDFKRQSEGAIPYHINVCSNSDNK